MYSSSFRDMKLFFFVCGDNSGKSIDIFNLSFGSVLNYILSYHECHECRDVNGFIVEVSDVAICPDEVAILA
jgi:hypothetical protein